MGHEHFNVSVVSLGDQVKRDALRFGGIGTAGDLVLEDVSGVTYPRERRAGVVVQLVLVDVVTPKTVGAVVNACDSYVEVVVFLELVRMQDTCITALALAVPV